MLTDVDVLPETAERCIRIPDAKECVTARVKALEGSDEEGEDPKQTSLCLKTPFPYSSVLIR